MKRLAALLAVAALALGAHAQSTNTPNLNLNLPVYGSFGWATRINANFSRLDSFLSGGLSLPQLTVNGAITNSRAPVAASDLANKAYVDSVLAAGGNASQLRGVTISTVTPVANNVLVLNAGQYTPTPFDAQHVANAADKSASAEQIFTGPVGLPADPTTALEAATKQYADNVAATAWLGGGTLTGPLTLAADPTSALQAATRQYVDAAARLWLAGGAMTGTLSLPVMQSSVRPFVDATAPPFSAVGDGVTDDTAAINAALTAAQRSTTNCGLGSTPPTASCTGVVLLPNRAFVASQLVIPNNVTLAGTGWQNTVLIQKANSNEHFIVGTNPATDQRITLRDLYINGNKSNQTGTTWDCIHFDSTGTLGDSTRSPRHTLQNVFVANCAEDGIVMTSDNTGAGSNYALNVKGASNGRYGMYLNTYDSHVDVGEFFSNGVAGMATGANGNGSIASVKSWGNGNGSTSGAGYLINSGNYRLMNDEAQDNSCNGFVLTGVTDSVATGLLTDGNGFTGGGNGCAGLVMSGSSNNRIDGVFRGVTDAGQSDYAIAWVGGNNNNLLDLIIDNPKVGNYSGTLGNNTLRSPSIDVQNPSKTFNNGSILRGYSDNQSTQQWSINGTNGQGNFKGGFQVGVAGGAVYSCGGPNNFDFANVSWLQLSYGSGLYNYNESSAGTCLNANNVPIQYQIPLRVAAGESELIGTTIASAATIAPAIPGIYHITGTTPISTITVPATCPTSGMGCRMTLIFDGVAPLATGGNIAAACTPSGSQELQMHYDPGTSLWYGTGCAPVSVTTHAFFGGNSGTTFTSSATNYGGGPVISTGTTLHTVGMTMHLDVTPVGCTTNAQVSLYDEGTLASPSTTLVTGSTLTLSNGHVDYNVAFSASLTGGHLYGWGTTVQQAGCTTNGGGPHFQVEYTM